MMDGCTGAKVGVGRRKSVDVFRDLSVINMLSSVPVATKLVAALPPMAMEGVPVITFHDATMYASDLKLLEEPNWLNDHCLLLCIE